MQPDSSSFYEEAKKSILYVTNRPEPVMERGEGMYLWDTDGKRYLDYIGGWAVTNLGHSPEVIAQALEKQARRLVNASPGFYNDQMLKFARLLTDISCFDKVFFVNSGSEANEGAIKLARKYGSKFKSGANEVITTIGSFHGRTLAMMAATGKPAWQTLFPPRVEGFVHVPYNDVEGVRAAMGPQTCAVMLEPIQGEGGVNVADAEYISGLRKLCDDNQILLIFDEVQTGIGRTGTMFAYEQYGVEPDIMTLAKGIGGGVPLSAVLAKARLDIFDAGDQGGTYSGQPLMAAVGQAVVREIIDGGWCENARQQGEYIVQRLEEIKERFGLQRIRGRGLLLGFDLPREMGQEVVAAAREEGLLLNSPQPATIRLMPPLIVAREQVDEMIEILVKVLSRLV
ncbi:MAG: acetylornithine/succinylornithine family transaminase [Firmicutes bacterium]|nr:acetylornithine/succinylornithine family transaminase [Bacillota bacterium]